MMHSVINRSVTLALGLLLKIKPMPEPKLYKGDEGIRNMILSICDAEIQRVLIMTSEGMVRRGVLEPFLKIFNEAGVDYTIFSDVPPNPTQATIEAAHQRCSESLSEAVLAYGGGSVIDAAKGVAALAGTGGKAKDLIGLFKVKQSLPLYVVPTTSGSGTEATNAAVISDPKTHQKGFIVDHAIVPTAAALDPYATLGLPQGLTASTGMDALTHAVESLVSKVEDEKSERYAIKAVRRIFQHLPTACRDGQNTEARRELSLAAYEAGVAFGRAGLGYVHAISHQLTAVYEIPHGVANAVLLPHVLEVQKQHCQPKLAKLARAVNLVDEQVGDLEAADALIGAIVKLRDELGLPSGFSQIQQIDYASIYKLAQKQAVFNFPVPRLMTEEQCVSILESLRTAELAEAA